MSSRRSFDSRPLTRSAESRREQCRALRADMRRSTVWRKCLATLSSLCLLQGHTRPVGRTEAWLVQHFLVPGHSASSPAARAADVASHFAEAFKMTHPRQRMEADLDPACRATIEWQCSAHLRGDDIRVLRNARLSAMVQCARDLEGWSRALEELAPSWLQDSKLPRPHHALFDLVSEVCQLPDTDLVDDLVCGAPAVGVCPDSGAFRRDWQPSAVSIDDLDHAAWHDEVHRQLSRAGADPARRAEHEALWARTAEEVANGFAFPLGGRKDAAAFFGGDDQFREMVRFAVKQKGKIRPCDNARVSLHNLATTLFERLSLESADFPARAASLYAELLGDTVFAFLLGTEDISAAYRRMPCAHPWFTVFAQWDPGVPGVREPSVQYFRLEGFNFGLKSAVVAFNRLAFCMQQSATRLLALCCASYFDDFCVAEPSFAKGGQQMLRDYASLLRVPFAGAFLGEPGSKSDAPSLKNTFLGVQHDFTRFARERISEAGIVPDRLVELAKDISEILEMGSFSSTAGPLKLAGRLWFTLSWAVGRFGRAALQPLHAASNGSRSEVISDELRRALSFIRDLLVDPSSGLPRLRPRKFRYKRSRLPAVLVWSDARWEASDERPAGMGFVVFFPETPDQARAATDAMAGRRPPWLLGAETPRGTWRYAAYDPDSAVYAHWRAREQYIGQLELLAAVSVYYSLRDDLRGREVIHFTDNAGALACLIKNYSSDIDSARLVHTFWALASCLEIDVWFEFVYSEANIADWPSRGDLAFANDLEALACEMRVPPSDSWGAVEAVQPSTGDPPAPPGKKVRRR